MNAHSAGAVQPALLSDVTVRIPVQGVGGDLLMSIGSILKKGQRGSSSKCASHLQDI